jgi:hypothetical protein
MSLSRLLLKLPSLKLKFLLLFPLLLIAFGLCGEALTNHVLSRSYQALDKLQADLKSEVQLVTNVLVVAAEIEKEQELTKVALKTTNSVLKQLEFELPVTDLSLVKATIAQELGLSHQVDLQAGTQMEVQLAVNVLGILAEIDKEQGFTKVEVKTANSVLKQLEFELPVTDLSLVKAAITQELGLSLRMPEC